MNTPEADAKRIRKFLHAPGGFKATGHKVHGNEKPCPEVFDELAGASRIAVADAPVHRKHYKVKVVSDFPDVFQFAQIAFFFLGRVNVHAEFLAMNQAALIIIGQEAGIPIVEVAGMEDTFTPCLYYPRHTAIGTAGSGDPDMFVLPDGPLGQPGIGRLAACPAVLQDILGQDISDIRPLFLPGENPGREMVFVKMAGQDIKRLARLQQTGHDTGRVHPIVEHQETGVRLEGKAAVEEVGESHLHVFC